MIRYVIDASAAVEYLLRTPLGLKLADAIEGAFLLAPELLDVEVLSVLRRAVLRQQLQERRAALASKISPTGRSSGFGMHRWSKRPGNIATTSALTTRSMWPSPGSTMQLFSPRIVL